MERDGRHVRAEEKRFSDSTRHKVGKFGHCTVGNVLRALAPCPSAAPPGCSGSKVLSPGTESGLCSLFIGFVTAGVTINNTDLASASRL